MQVNEQVTKISQLRTVKTWQQQLADSCPEEDYQQFLKQLNKVNDMATVMINIASKDVPDSVRVTGMADFILTIQDNDVILNVDGNTKFERIQDCYWNSLAYCKSFKVTSEDLGIAFLMETKR